MPLPAQSMSQTLSRGWKWWTNELAGMIPGSGRDGLRNLPPGVILSMEPSGLRLIDERGRKRGDRNGSTVPPGTDAWDGLVEIARSRSKVPVRLRLPYASCFVRHVALPAALRDEAKKFLDLDLERATPFRLKDVYTAHFIDEAHSQRDTLSVSQLIVRKDVVDQTIADIQSSGIKLASVDCWNEDATAPLPVDFLPRDLAAERRASGSPRLMKLMLVAAVSLCGHRQLILR